jgi:hypothetical protein
LPPVLLEIVFELVLTAECDVKLFDGDEFGKVGVEADL